jgi:hypothetical protein
MKTKWFNYKRDGAPVNDGWYEVKCDNQVYEDGRRIEFKDGQPQGDHGYYGMACDWWRGLTVPAILS